MFSPFTGILFDPDRIPDLGAIASPPYDVISPEERRSLEEASPYNLVRLLLAREGDERYQQVAESFRRWRREGILIPDPGPRFYLYEIESGSTSAHGVLGALAVQELGETVLAHEEVMDQTKADRMAVLTATEANLDVIVGLTPTVGFAALLEPPGPPRLDFQAGGLRHRLYDLTDPGLVGAISAEAAEHPVSIADGHHRYSTAIQYAARRRRLDGAGGWDGILCFLAPVDGDLSIGPIHRVFAGVNPDLERLRNAFDVHPLDGPPALPPAAGELVLVPAPPGRPLRLHAHAATLRRLPEPWREASTAVAREALYPLLDVDEGRAEYLNDAEAALRRAAELKGGLAVLNAPVSEHAISAATDRGLRFPPKTTYFYPKPWAGLVIRAFDTD